MAALHLKNLELAKYLYARAARPWLSTTGI